MSLLIFTRSQLQRPSGGIEVGVQILVAQGDVLDRSAYAYPSDVLDEHIVEGDSDVEQSGVDLVDAEGGRW